MPQDTRVFVVHTECRNIRTAAAPDRRRNGLEQLSGVEVRDDGIGDAEQQIELVAFLPKDFEKVGQPGIRREHGRDVDKPWGKEILLWGCTLHNAPTANQTLRRTPVPGSASRRAAVPAIGR
jgi:hypothetical protein